MVHMSDETTETITEEGQSDLVGVLVIKTKDDGAIKTDVQIVGEVEPTEVQTLLELGVLSWRQKIGLSG